MGSIKVILNQDISNLGEEGDVKIVKKGYARNYLIPNNLALDFSLKNRKLVETKKEYYENRKLEKKENAAKLKEKLENEKIKIEVAAGDKGRLYGTITSQNIAEELNKLNYNIDKRKIELTDHIKFSGTYKYRIHLYHDIYAQMELTVIAKQEKVDSHKSRDRKDRKNYSRKQTKSIEKESEEKTPEETQKTEQPAE